MIFEIICCGITLVGASIAYYLYNRNKIELKVETIVNDLIMYGDKELEERMPQVINELQKVVPTILKPFITAKTLENIVRQSYTKVKIAIEEKVTKN